MSQLLEKPAGSMIQERQTPDGLTLRWKLPETNAAGCGIFGFFSVWLCGWVIGETAMAFAMFQNGFQPLMAIWLVGWTIGGGFVWYVVAQILKPMRPERVTLLVDALGHDPGHQPTVSTPFAPPRAQTTPPLRVKRADVREFVLERVGERQRLCLDSATERREIGPTLSEPDREWLHAALERWRRDQSMTPPTPASGSPAAQGRG